MLRVHKRIITHSNNPLVANLHFHSKDISVGFTILEYLLVACETAAAPFL